MVGLWGREDALEEEMATHSSILARRVPWTGKPSGLHGVTKNQDMTEGHHHDEHFRNTHLTADRQRPRPSGSTRACRRLLLRGSGRSSSETQAPSAPVQGSSGEAAARVLRG